MAESIIIRFGTRALDKAREQAQAIASALKDSKDLLRGLAPAARKAFKAAVRAGLKERTDAIDIAQKRLANSQLQRSQRGVDALDDGAGRGIARIGRRIDRLGMLGGGLAAVITSDDPTGLKGLQLALHGLHAAAPGSTIGIIAAVASQVLSVLEAQIAKDLAQAAELLNAEIENRLAEADTSKRYQDDPNFRAAEQRRARALYVHDAALGLEPRSSSLLGSD